RGRRREHELEIAARRPRDSEDLEANEPATAGQTASRHDLLNSGCREDLSLSEKAFEDQLLIRQTQDSGQPPVTGDDEVRPRQKLPVVCLESGLREAVL